MRTRRIGSMTASPPVVMAPTNTAARTLVRTIRRYGSRNRQARQNWVFFLSLRRRGRSSGPAAGVDGATEGSAAAAETGALLMRASGLLWINGILGRKGV